MNNELAEAVYHWASTIGIGIALAGAIGAYWKYRVDRRYREWERARQSYGIFMDSALANSEFYPRCWSDFSDSDPATKNRFRWYIARFLWAAEEILLAMPVEDEAWTEAIKIFIREHADFFRSQEAKTDMGSYYLPLRSIVEEALHEAAASEALELPPGFRVPAVPDMPSPS